MSWTLISVILFFIFFYALDRRIKRIEEARGRGFSWAFNIDALESVLQSEMFGRITGIKSAEKGRPYKEWTEAEKNIWHKKYHETIAPKTQVRLTYLVSEDAFFVKGKDAPSVVLHDVLGSSYIYTINVIGDKNEIESYLEFGLTDRIKKDKGIYQRVITGYLKEHKGISETGDFKVLFDLPFTRNNMSDEDFKSLGYDIEHMGGDDIYQDDFGETHSLLRITTLKKNGAKIWFGN
ncbi:hypothetical protein C4577_00370 [Candidatus Parcubacteria bacterium]|nr:MAG: hypothetical protein C4577_00370 [Candidatus Parcubacteria bacterium]